MRGPGKEGSYTQPPDQVTATFTPVYLTIMLRLGGSTDKETRSAAFSPFAPENAKTMTLEAC